MGQTIEKTRIKVLVADEDYQVSFKLAAHLEAHGLETRAVKSGLEAKAIADQWHPDFIIIDLMMRDFNAFSLLKHTKITASLKHTKICVMSSHNSESNVRAAIDAGARDYLVKPLSFDDILSRLILHSQDSLEVKQASENFKKENSPQVLLQLFDLILSQALSRKEPSQVLFNLTRMAAMKVKGVRCSIIECPSYVKGKVIASSDDNTVTDLKLNLNKYPEVQLVLNSQKTLALENLMANDKMRPVIEKAQSISFNSIIVCPVYFNHRTFGVVSVRMGNDKMRLAEEEVRFIEVISKIITLYLSQSEEAKASENNGLRLVKN